MLKQKKLQYIVLISTIASVITGCQDVKLNPYKIDEDIPYYKDVGIDEDNLQENKIMTSEDGAASTIYHKTVQLPDKKLLLRRDPQYVKYENTIKDTMAYIDGNNIETVYAATYSDLSNSNITVTLQNNTIVLTNFQYKTSDTIVLTIRNYSDSENIDLGETGLTVYIYDQSGDTIGVIQPTGTIKDVDEIVLQSPTIVYTSYIGFSTGVQKYTEYEQNLSDLLNELENVKNKSGRILY